MKAHEYVKTIVYNGHMINIGIDDYGKEYFLEYVDDKGQLTTDCCGACNTDYQQRIEYLFGNPDQCIIFGTVSVCEQTFAHGYCARCPYNSLWHIHDKF